MKGMHKHAIALLLSASLLQSNVMPLWANTAPSVRETNQVDELDDFSKGGKQSLMSQIIFLVIQVA